MHRGIGTHEGEAVWQGKDEWEEGVGVEEEQHLRRQSRLEQPSSWADEVTHQGCPHSSNTISTHEQ
jgi:hypothetical protein